MTQQELIQVGYIRALNIVLKLEERCKEEKWNYWPKDVIAIVKDNIIKELTTDKQ